MSHQTGIKGNTQELRLQVNKINSADWPDLVWNTRKFNSLDLDNWSIRFGKKLIYWTSKCMHVNILRAHVNRYRII